MYHTIFFTFIFIFIYFQDSFSVALEPVLGLALVGQAGPELTEMLLPLPPKRWD